MSLSADDRFRIGRNTKTMTSTAVLQLVQEGVLRLGEAVSKYWAGVPNGDRMTIGQRGHPSDKA